MLNTNMQDNCTAGTPTLKGTAALVSEIIQIAQSGLPRMFNAERQLFCFTLRRDSSGKLVQEGISHRYTMMTLLGLHRLEVSGTQSPISIGPVMDALTHDLNWVQFAGDLGVLLWLCAIVDPGRVNGLMKKVDYKESLHRYKDARQRSTTELAWILTGLSHAKLAGISCIPEQDRLAESVYELLKTNQGSHGIFGHMASNGSWAGRFRGRAGSFADQVYPIYALAQYGRAYGDPEAIRRARECAEAIVRLQGPQGEWWWHYDAVNGEVSRPYPVYSVHQHGMAPMALHALEEVAGMDFSEAIDKGLRWIDKQNALDIDMRASDAGLVWRGIYWNHVWSKSAEMASLYLGTAPIYEIRNPRIFWECRPYELGWALYAFAGRLENRENNHTGLESASAALIWRSSVS